MGEKMAADVALNDAPWWVRVGTVFGIPTVVLLLVLFGTYKLLASQANDVAKGTQAILQEMTKHGFDTSVMLQTQRDLVTVVRANCYNNAHDEESRIRCMK